MKKFLLTMLVFVCGALIAREVTPKEAVRVAETWAKRNAALAGERFHAQTPIAVTAADGTVLYYKVMLGERGMVIVSGDTNIAPVIAALPEATSPEIEAGHPLNALLLSDMTARRALLVASGSQLRSLSSSADVSETIAQNNSRWDDLLGTPSGIQTFALNAVGAPARVYSYPKPWSTRQITHWHQISQNQYVTLEENTLYNWKLPGLSGGIAPYAGCVAIAGSAILEFFQVPEGPKGIKCNCEVNGNPIEITTYGGAYNWSLLPTWKKNVALDDDARDLVARVAADVGFLVGTNYKDSASSANSAALAEVLTTHFGFKNAVYQGYPDVTAYVYPQVRAGAPVFLGISDGGTGGHAVVAVGYGEDDSDTPYTRVFMGWGGAGDAWYALPNIRGGDFYEGAGNYNILLGVITGIALPPKDENVHEEHYDIVAICGRVTNTAGHGVPYEPVKITFTLQNPETQESIAMERSLTTGLHGEYAVRLPFSTRYTIAVGNQIKTIQNAVYPKAVDFEIEGESVLSVYVDAQEAIDTAIQEGKLLFVLSGPAWDADCAEIKKVLVALGTDFSDDFIFYYNDTDYGLSTMNVGTPGYAVFDPRTFALSSGANGNVALGAHTSSATDIIQGVLATSLEKQGSSGIDKLEIVGEKMTVDGGTYTLQVTYADGLSQTLPDVMWSVDGNATITDEGVLSFTETETAASITIKATTILHGEQKTVTITVRKVARSEITGITITGIEGNTINLEETPNPVFTCTATLTDGTMCRVVPSWGMIDASQLYFINDSGGLIYGKDSPKKANHTVTLTATYDDKSVTLDCTIYGYAGIYVSEWDFSPKETYPGAIVRVVITELLYTYAGQTSTISDTSLAEYKLIESSTGKATYFSTDEIEIAIPKGATSGGKVFVLTARKKGGQNTEYQEGTSNSFGVRPLEQTTRVETGSVPYGWLSQQFPTEGITDYETKAGDDDDCDGYANWKEYVLGTDPQDAESTLRLNLTVPTDGGLPEVTWNERPGRTYKLLGADSLSGPWGDVTETSRFFKVSVEMN